MFGRYPVAGYEERQHGVGNKLNMKGIVAKVTGVVAFAAVVSLGLLGCAGFRPKILEKYVYVTAKQTFLRDRVAAVSNRTGSVTNGEKLIVLDHQRRFLKVRTPQGEVGWIEEKLTAGQDVADRFEKVGKDHAKDPTVANATARDEVYLHLTPGKETERFYRLAEGDTLSLLQRATIVKPTSPGAGAAARPVPGAAASQVAEIPMEDWWLVRDGKGDTGWIYSHMIDVSAPDALARYAEGQRFVGAYVLGHADDPESGVMDAGNVVSSIPEYVTVLSPYKAGLAYDFDQVRVFTWNVKKHRYETAFREHNVAGYLPVVIGTSTDPYGHAANSAEKLPSFTYRVLAGDQTMPVPDPASGAIRPGKMVTKTFRLEGNLCRRIVAPGTVTPAEAHPDVVVEKKKASSRKGK